MKTKQALQLMVFTQSRASRSFEIPVRWIFGVGAVWITSIFLTLTLTGAIVYQSVRLKKLRVAHPSTQEAKELRQKVSELENRISELTQNSSTVHAHLMSLDLPSPITNAKITLSPVKTRFANGKWRIQFQMQYVAQDGGNQQGTFLLLGQGPGVLQSFPPGVIQANSGKQGLLQIDQAETFSVSRFRDTQAVFGPFESSKSIQSIRILIFGTQQELLIDQTQALQ